MIVENGLEQRRETVVRLREVDIGARLQQDFSAVNGALARGQQERRQPATGINGLRATRGHFAEAKVEKSGLRIHIRSGSDEEFGDIRVVFRDSPHQRGLSAVAVLGIDLGAGSQQGIDASQASRARRRHQRSFAFAESGVGIGPGFDQCFDHRAVTRARGLGERGHIIAVSGLGVGSGGEQQLHGFGVIEVRGPDQGRHAIDIGDVDVRLLFEQRA